MAVIISSTHGREASVKGALQVQPPSPCLVTLQEEYSLKASALGSDLSSTLRRGGSALPTAGLCDEDVHANVHSVEPDSGDKTTLSDSHRQSPQPLSEADEIVRVPHRLPRSPLSPLPNGTPGDATSCKPLVATASKVEQHAAVEVIHDELSGSVTASPHRSSPGRPVQSPKEYKTPTPNDEDCDDTSDLRI